MPCLITALTRSHSINKTTEKKTNKFSKKKKNTAKIQQLNLKAPGNNVKIQSENLNSTKLLFHY